MTRFEHIKTMSIEEMAVMFADEIPHGDCCGCYKCYGCHSPYRLNDECQDGWLEWLEREVEDNEYDKV